VSKVLRPARHIIGHFGDEKGEICSTQAADTVVQFLILIDINNFELTVDPFKLVKPYKLCYLLVTKINY